MIRFALLLTLSFLLTGRGLAQYGNEWINPDQQYVRIPVAKNGLYRVSFAALAAGGFTVANKDNLQLYHRGVEQSIIVGTDYIEFFGRKNDGAGDTRLYENPTYQPHTLYNIFTDTTSYFVTEGSIPGKRMERYEEMAAGEPVIPYAVTSRLLVFTEDYARGRDYGQILKTAFDQGEGWMSRVITPAGGIYYDSLKNILNGASSYGKPSLEMVVTGRGRMQHRVEILIGGSGRTLTTFTVDGFESRRINFELEWSDIGADGSLRVGVKVSAINATTANVSVNFMKVEYPAETEFSSGEIFELPSEPSGRSLLQLQNAPAGARLFDITNPSDPRSIGTTGSSLLQAVILSTATPRTLFLATAEEVTDVHPVNFIDIDPRAYNYIILSHSLLRKPSGAYADPVQAYADYRASAEGGGYFPLVLDVESVYDQFNYGEKSPLAIYNLMKFLSATRFPDYFFIIGKGLDVEYDYFRKPEAALPYRSLVPSAGMPAADMLFTAGLDGTVDVPAVPTGRLVALQPAHVAAYLDKVKETEARPFDDLRRKHILHLSGGIYQGEPEKFRSFLQEFQTTAEGFYLGGKVDVIAKQSLTTRLINISKEVNQGLNLVTFFGHSSEQTFDFDIGEVTDETLGYDNKGRYPVLLMNGCLAGSFFRAYPLFGEGWVNTRDKGAIGFIAHSYLGYDELLKKYSGLFYQVGYGDSVFISRGLGDIQKEVARRFLMGTDHLAGDVTQVQQMMLLGDPAIRLFGASRPDYAISDENISIRSLDEQPVTAASDSFSIRFIARNFGIASNKPLSVRVVRTFSDRRVLYYDSVYSPVLYADTLDFIIRGSQAQGFGKNTFELRVDPDAAISEIREDNNSGYIDFFIPENGTKNLYPVNFAIVSRRDLSLAFQHTDLHSAERAFLLEIDTAADFSSPFLTSFTLAAKVLGRQQLLLPETDTMVYYWRTRLAEPLENESTEWTATSFTYIPAGAPGWAQSAFPQYASNLLEGFVNDPGTRHFAFTETVTPLYIRTFGSLSSEPAQSVSVLIDSAEYNLYTQNWGCRNNTINLIAFDRRSTAPYSGVVFQWFNNGGRACGREPWVINSFAYNELITGGGDDLQAYIQNVANGDSVVLFSIGNANYELWPELATTSLAQLGISPEQISALTPGEPVIIFGRKGLAPGSARVVTSSDSEPAAAMLETSSSITGRYTSATMRSVAVGPAVSWSRLVHQNRGGTGTDSFVISVYGISGDGNEQLLADSAASGLDLSFIDATEHPKLRLVFRATDDVELTPVQLRSWIVNFEPAPEGMVFYSGSLSSETIQEGVSWTGHYGFINISDGNFGDSVTVNSRVFNHSRLSARTSTFRISPPAPGDTTLFSLNVDTKGIAGLNDVEILVNPFILPEYYYDNNVFVLNEHIDVFSEHVRPVLDVTVNGRYISRDEYVERNPEIVVRIRDENNILLKSDTTGVDIFIASPCDEEPCAFRRLMFSDARVQWFPATATRDFRVVFFPSTDLPGRYTLRVSATDESGNRAGDEPYEISFMISDETVVVFSDPFPNPAVEELRFQLELNLPEPVTRIGVKLLALDGRPATSLDISPGEVHTGDNNIVLRLPPLPAGIYLYDIMLQTPGRQFIRRGKLMITR